MAWSIDMSSTDCGPVAGEGKRQRKHDSDRTENSDMKTDEQPRDNDEDEQRRRRQRRHHRRWRQTTTNTTWHSNEKDEDTTTRNRHNQTIAEDKKGERERARESWKQGAGTRALTHTIECGVVHSQAEQTRIPNPGPPDLEFHKQKRTATRTHPETGEAQVAKDVRVVSEHS